MSVELSSAKYFQEKEESADMQAALAAENRANPLQRNAHRQQWSGKLTLICVLCGLFGCWGLLWSGLGVASVVNEPAQLAKIQKQGKMPPAMVQSALKMQKKFAVPQIFLLIIKGGVAVLFLLSCATLAVKKSTARQLAVTTCYAAIGYHVMNAGLKGAYIVGMSKMAKELAMRKGAAGNLDAMMGVFSFAGVIGIMVALIFFLVVYGAMAMYLCSTSVRRMFGEDPYPERADMARRVERGMQPSVM